MRHREVIFSLALLMVAWTGCGQPKAPTTAAPKPTASTAASAPVPTPSATAAAAAAPSPPVGALLDPWPGPDGGVPPFDRITLEQFRPALEQAMASTLSELDRIAHTPAPPTFDNTLAAMERATRMIGRVRAVYDVWCGAKQTPEFQKIEQEMGPKLAAFDDAVTQNEALFGRIRTVYEARETASLSPEQKRLAWLTHTSFVRAGAKLDAAGKARMRQINGRLATLFTTFGQNVLNDESGEYLVLESEAELAGLPTSLRDAAAAEATERKLAGKWVIRNTRSAVEPFLTFSDRRDLRERAWRMFVSRGDGGGKTDNKAIITEILALRAERAKLLGYATHAHWRLEDTMAKTPEAALELMRAVWKPAVERVRQEVTDMQALANREKTKLRIEPWDYRYYAEKVRRQKYDLDDNLIKPYLQLEKMREAMFWVAGELLGFEFRPRSDVPVFAPDVRVWDVVDKATGRKVGLYYFDPYARTGKRSGAWMSEYRTQERLDGETIPIVSNNANFLKGKPGEPVLVSWDDAETMFHEFGHALHGLSSSVTYRSLGGTSVFRDYVELPSQLLENWLSTPEVLGRFALHYQTGKPMPPELVKRIERASTFNQGFSTVEYLSSALVDMELHLAGSKPIDPDAFERDTLKTLGMPREIVMRHRTPQFQHVFASDDYSAGYYSYLWADVLSSDAFAAFREAHGPFDHDVAKRLREYVFSVGNSVDPAEGYRRFRGHDPTIDALMRKRGFPLPGKGAGKAKGK